MDAFHPIVDLHAITVPQEPEELRESTLDLAALLIACGLDPDVCTLFVQSHVPEHPRLSWVLECMTPLGELRRMPQFREKSAAQASFSVGLMTYPVLQAADILLYDADVVPVGEDQRQHLELARDLAQRFNQRFGETFVVPEGTYGDVGAKIMDLQDPESRMSTSLSSELGIVKVLDPPDIIRRKVRSAVTDSGRDVVRAEDKPGVTNLIEIMAVATGEEPEAIEARYDGAGYGRFKQDVAEAVVELLDPIRLRYGELRGDPPSSRHPRQGAEKAHAIAAATLARAHERSASSPPGNSPLTWTGSPPASAATSPGVSSRQRAGLDALERQAGVLAAVEAQDRVADRRAHPLHLVLAALVERELEPAGPQAARRGGRRPSVVELDAFGEPAQRLVAGLPLDLGLVDLVHLVTRVHEPVRERPVVRGRSAPVVSASSRPTGTTRCGTSTRSTTVGRPCGSLAVVATPAGLCRST